jgi:hypothetical protein
MRLSGIVALLGTLATTVAALPAEAALVQKGLSGVVTRAETNNIFGIGLDHRLTGRLAYDDSRLTGLGFETLRSDRDLDIELEFRIGSFAFDESDNVFGISELSFFDGRLTQVSFAAPAPDDLDFFRVGSGLQFSFTDGFVNEKGERVFPRVVDGEFELVDFVPEPGPAPIPEPGALVLFGAGLAGLGLLRRRHA